MNEALCEGPWNGGEAKGPSPASFPYCRNQESRGILCQPREGQYQEDFSPAVKSYIVSDCGLCG